MKRVPNQVVVGIDIDDTLCNTQMEVLKRLYRYLFDKGMLDAIEEVRVLAEVEKVSTMLFPDHFRKIINEEIIGKKEYISSVRLTNFAKGLTRFQWDADRELGRNNVHFVIATHRPDDYMVRNRTIAWIRKQELSFNKFHFIDPAQNANKIEFLEKEYPNCKILLIDDNPLGKLNVEHPHNPSVLVYKDLCDYKAYKHQDKFTDFDNLLERVKALAYGTEYSEVCKC